MGIYSDSKINEIINKKDLVIYPYKDENLTGIGYDIRVGIIQPLSGVEEFREDYDFYYLPPKSYCVVVSKEFVWLSTRLAATLHARGTLAAKGLYTNCTNIDPNFQGQLIMSVHNVSDKIIKIGKEEHYITMIIHNVLKPTKTLLGDDSKNSIRVTKDLKEIYGDEITNQINILHEYLVNERTETGGKFQQLISVAKNKNPFKYFSKEIIKAKILTFSTLLYIVIFTVLIILVLLIFNEKFNLIKEETLTFLIKVFGLLGVILALVKADKK